MTTRTKRRETDATFAAVDAAYDRGPTDTEWFSQLIQAHLPLLDHGLGVGGLIAVKSKTPGLPTIEATHVETGPDDLMARQIESAAALPAERTHEQTYTGVFVVSERTAEYPAMLETWRTFFDGAADAIGVMTVDTDGRGVLILAPTPEVVELGPRERSRWEMVAAHLASGARLRSALKKQRATVTSESGLPLGADAIIDPTDFRITDGGQSDTNEALADWWALVGGQWSMVDWFDTDDRRFVLALPNPPSVPNPRGLTEQEQRVIAFAALGDSHKLIAYRLGLSRSRVSHLVASGMRKLGTKTQAELVQKLRAFL